MGTAGAITVYCFGNRVGFCKEVQNGQAGWNIEQKIFWWRSKLAEAGADTWYGVLGCGTIVEMQDVILKLVMMELNFGKRSRTLSPDC